MVNKRAQIFSLYIVIFTLFLCGVSIALYMIQQENVQAFVVSPTEVLETRTELSIFELREVELIKDSLDNANGDFGSDVFKESFRDNFIDGVMVNDDMKIFLFEDLFVGDVEVRDMDKNRNLLEDGIYTENLVFFDNGKLNFGREKIEKRVFLTAANTNKDFPVFFSFEFEQEYLIEKVGQKFEVTKV